MWRCEFNRFRKRRFVHEKRLRSYPAVKLCRLGVDISMKGTGLGSIILSLIEFLCTQGNRIGCRFITVDAYKTATPFYIKKWLSTALKRNIELFYRTIIHGFTFGVIKTKPCHCLHKAKAKISSKRKEIFRFSFACFVYFVYFCHQYVNLITMIF